MMNKKMLAASCAALMMLCACTACDSSSSTGTTTTTAATTTTTAATAATVATTTAAPVDFEKATVAKDGDAILAIVDGQWYVQYWGKEDDLLTYDAGIATLKGDGDYTVSVNAGTKGCKFDITGDANGEYECVGLSFMAVKVIGGTTLYPNLSIAVKEVRVDGKAITLKKKNYTSSDDKVEMRANIYNQYVNTIPEDAHTAEGMLTAATSGDYSAQIVETKDFTKWTKVEVDFTVSGLGDAATGETGTAAATTTAASSTTAAQ